MHTSGRWAESTSSWAMLLLACAVAGCGAAARAALPPADSHADATPPGPMLRVARAPTAEELFGTVEADADATAQVTAIADGRIARLFVAEGQSVRAGQLLATIDSPAAADLRGRLEVATADLEAAAANERRQRALAAAGIASQRDAEVAALEAAAAEAELKSTRAELGALGFAARDLDAQGGARSGLVPLRAPIDGTIVRRLLTLGASVRTGALAFRIVDLRRLVVRLRFPEANQLSVGTRFAVSDATGGAARVAVVSLVAPQVDPATHTAEALAALTSPDGRAFIGQLVTAVRYASR